MYFYRLQLGQVEVMSQSKFHLSSGVPIKISLNSVYVNGAAF